jgi:phage gpG-like protein
MFRFRLEIAGEVQMDRGIQRFSEAVADYRPIWPVIADDFYAMEKDQFRSEGREGGEAWQPLSPAVKAWKEVHYPGKPILQRTGDLEASLTKPGDPNAVKVEARMTLTLGSKVPYAIYHQSPKPRKKLPRRPEIMLSEEFKRDTMRNIQVYLIQIANQAGLRSGLGPLESSRLAKYFGKGIPPRGTSPRRGSDGTRLF